MRVIQPIIARWEKIICTNSFFLNIYLRRYLKVVKREISLANITSSDVVLNIGCGALPFTSIYISKLTRARLIAIDKDKDAVKRAKRCLKNLEMENFVDVMLLDAAEMIPQGFSVAIVALQAEPKDEIINTLFRVAKSGTRMVFRKPSKSFENHYDKLPNNIVPVGVVKQDKPTFDASIMVMK